MAQLFSLGHIRAYPKMLDFFLPCFFWIGLGLWAVIYIGKRGLTGMRADIRFSEFSRFSARGFSVKRMAYLLTGVSALLVPLHWWADWQGDGYLAGVAFLLMLAALILGFFVPKIDKDRFLPFALGVVVFILHGMLMKA